MSLSRSLMKLPPEIVADGGLDLARETPENVARLTSFISDNFLPVDLQAFPGTRLLNIDPPIVSIPNFLPPEVCDGLVLGAVASAKMTPSGVAAYNAPDNVRTSTTLPLTKDVLPSGGALASVVNEVLQRAMRLAPLGLPTDVQAPGTFLRPSKPEQWVYEQAQVTRYEQGEHFLAHEDAFPPPIARGKGYQRHATLLMYLNDCGEGGATHFEVLDISSRPQKGKGLLFFPALLNSVPDSRTVHTAQDAVDTKWVSQLWFSRGLRTPENAAAAAAGAAGAAGALQPRQKVGGSKDGPSAAKAAKKAKKKAAPAGKGFGSR